MNILLILWKITHFVVESVVVLGLVILEISRMFLNRHRIEKEKRDWWDNKKEVLERRE